MKLTIRKKGLFGKEERIINTRKIAGILLVIMKRHIGINKGVYKPELFSEIFRQEFDDSSATHWVMWEFVKKAMHFLRVNSNCFIVNTTLNNKRMYLFFVINESDDVKYYQQQLERSISNMKKMQQRAQKALSEGWAHQDWKITYYHKPKEINYEM